MSTQTLPAAHIPDAILHHNASCPRPLPMQVFSDGRAVQVICASCGYPQHCSAAVAAGKCGTHAIAYLEADGFRCAQHGGLIECPSCSFPTAPADGPCPECGHVENDKSTLE